MQELRPSQTSAHTRATRRNVPEDGILQMTTTFSSESNVDKPITSALQWQLMVPVACNFFT
jgi:hypothetical protein